MASEMTNQDLTPLLMGRKIAMEGRLYTLVRDTGLREDGKYLVEAVCDEAIPPRPVVVIRVKLCIT